MYYIFIVCVVIFYFNVYSNFFVILSSRRRTIHEIKNDTIRILVVVVRLDFLLVFNNALYLKIRTTATTTPCSGNPSHIEKRKKNVVPSNRT